MATGEMGNDDDVYSEMHSLRVNEPCSEGVQKGSKEQTKRKQTDQMNMCVSDFLLSFWLRPLVPSSSHISRV